MAFDFKSKNWDLPFFGEIDRNWILIGGVGTVALVFLIRYRINKTSKKNQQQQQPVEVFIAGQIGTDPAGNVGPIDPETGFVYNSPEDLARLGELAIEEYAEVVYYPSQFVPDLPGEHGDRDRSGREIEDEKDKDHRTGHKRTVEQWIRDALEDFSGEFGRDHLEDTIHAILGGHPVTSGQKAIFLEVVAKEGKPPGGYPPITLVDTDAQPGKPRRPHEPLSPPNSPIVPVG